MTEAKWLAGKDPHPMLKFLKGRTDDRVLWLFTAACLRRVWPALDENVRSAVEATERYADGRAADQEMLKYNSVIDALNSAQAAVNQSRERVTGKRERSSEPRAQADLLREIVGNPFRTVSFSPDWRTDTALSLARQMYESRDFSAMPILADALQDAGCDNDEILTHCRQGGEHVRGCWVIDLLGKRGESVRDRMGNGRPGGESVRSEK